MLHAKRTWRFALSGLLVLSLLAVGCSRGAQPRGWAAPARAGGILMVSSKEGRLDGLDSQTKELRWHFPNDWSLPKGISSKLTGIYGAPVVSQDGSVVFFGDYNGYVYAFRPADRTSGASEKPKAAGVKLDGGPIVGGIALDTAGGNLLVAAGSKLYRVPASQLSARTTSSNGDLKPELIFTAGDHVWGTPVLSGGKVFVTSLDGNLYALDASTGKEAWRFGTGRAFAATPTISGSTILVGGFDRRMHALDIATGSEKWSFEAANWVWSRPVTDGSRAYFGDFDGNVYAVNLTTGEKVWSFGLDKGAIRSGLALAGGVLVVATEDGWLVGLDPASHAIQWSKDVGTAVSADLVVADSAVLLAPSGCVTASDGGDKVYYASVDPATGELSRAGGLC